MLDDGVTGGCLPGAEAHGAVIRRAAPAEAEPLARLRFEFRAEIAEGLEEDEGSFVARCTAWMRPRLVPESRWRCWVAERDGRIVGHIWLQRIEKVPNPVDEAEEHAYITNMHVLAQERGHGTGSRLLSHALDWCRANRVHAVILWPSERSRPLYERHGFSVREDVLGLDLDAGAEPPSG